MLVVQAAPAAMAGLEVRATVLSIGDGDTIHVQQGQQRITIRLACIDAPEMAQAPMAPTPAATCRAGCGWAPA
ncbi:hypothetical protein [Synechococcus sp. CBW1107]|uniref:thermonuclease family protein n=1 Tax=Synechococcus sp. CBW1107 TaxID=2789857 RepID=UPI002AD41A30|nr:hypothetical protein [Synechococcus sp. CBW1107]